VSVFGSRPAGLPFTARLSDSSHRIKASSYGYMFNTPPLPDQGEIGQKWPNSPTLRTFDDSDGHDRVRANLGRQGRACPTYRPEVSMKMRNKQPVRVLIVEDQQVVADALRKLIDDQPDMLVVAAAGSVAKSLSCATELHPDIVLLDYRLPDGSGIDAASTIRRLQPSSGLIFVTRDDREKTRLAAFEVGAKAFVPKSKAATELVGTIRAVAAGGSLLQPPTMRHGVRRPIDT
jgi:CheY-like chemotaxis protein